MAKVTVVTLVHNPGEYIYPCVDSVLNQTFKDFSYVIIDNASSDGTKEVLEEYAKRDARVRLYRNEDNNVGSIKAIDTYVDTEYYMVLDHDDYLEPEALELLYAAAIKEDLDMVFGRCEMVDARGNALDEAGMQQEMSYINEVDFINYFDVLYWQLRTQWGKLIRKRLIQHIDMETMNKRAASGYAGDTVMILSMAFAAKRFGTVGKVLHHYRILDKSQSRTYNRQRFLADWVMLDMARDLLREREGLTLRNEIYLYRVYFSAICDTLRILIESDGSDEERIDVISEIVVKEHTGKMCKILKKYTPEEYQKFVSIFGQTIVSLYQKNVSEATYCGLVKKWMTLLYGEENCIEIEFAYLYEYARAITLLLCLGRAEQAYRDMEDTKCPERCPILYISLALSYEKDIKRMAKILFCTGQTLPEIYSKAETAIRILTEQNSMLCGLDRDVSEENPEIVAAVCSEEYLVAANFCLDRLTEEKWQKSGGILELALTLAAVLGDAEAFVMLKKCKCEYLIREGKREEAEAELLDLEEMCPGDEEAETLRSMM